MSIPEAQKFANLVNALNQLLARQERLEARLARLEQGLAPQPAALVETPVAPIPVTPLSPVVEETPVAPSALRSEVEPEPREPNAESHAHEVEKIELESKVGLTLINRIGVVTLVLGVAFFFKWAVDNNWIGPSGRVILGLLAGFAALFLADVLWRKSQQVFAQGVTGAGIGIVYLAFYAAFDFYHLIPQAVAFVLLLATTAMAATLAVRYNSMAIAALGFFGAYLIPLLLSTGEDHPWFLISYLLLLNFAATELGKRRTWPVLEILSFIASAGIFGAWLLSRGHQQDDQLPASIGLLALCAQRFRTQLTVLFAITQALTMLGLAFVYDVANSDKPSGLCLILLVTGAGLAFAHLRKYWAILPSVFAAFWLTVNIADGTGEFMLVASIGFSLFAAWTWWRFVIRDEEPNAIGFSVFALNGVVFYALAYWRLQAHYHHWLGLLAVAVAAFYLAFGMLMYRRKALLDMPVVLLALGISVAFLTLAIPIQLTGFSVAIAWSIQAAALTWIAVRLVSFRAAMAAMAVFALALWHVTAVDSLMYPNPASYSFLLNTRFFVFAVLAAALLLSAYWLKKLDKNVALASFIGGHMVMLGGLTLEVIGWAQRTSPPALSLAGKLFRSPYSLRFTLFC